MAESLKSQQPVRPLIGEQPIRRDIDGEYDLVFVFSLGHGVYVEAHRDQQALGRRDGIVATEVVLDGAG
jgi:hypothetical protein